MGIVTVVLAAEGINLNFIVPLPLKVGLFNTRGAVKAEFKVKIALLELEVRLPLPRVSVFLMYGSIAAAIVVIFVLAAQVNL